MASEFEDIDRSIVQEDVLSLSRELIKIPSVFGEEQAVAEFVHRKLTQWGFSPRFIEVEGFGPCVVAEAGATESPRVVLNGHMDTVEVMSGWTRDPFGASVENGHLYGLGALDMKCGLAAMMIAFKAVAQTGLALGARVCLHAVSGEEKDGNGTRRLIELGEYRDASAVVVGEGFGGLKVLTHGRRGGSYYDIFVRGKSAHGAVPHMGVNAVVDAASIVCSLGRLEMRQADGLFSEDGAPLKETMTVLSMKGGTDSLSVPDNCAVRFVKSTVPGGVTDSTAEVESIISGLGIRSEASVVLNTDPKDLYYPYVTPANSRLVEIVSEAVHECIGQRPKLACGISEADDNIIARETRIPVVCVGPGASGTDARYHQAEEAIGISQLNDAAKVFARTVVRLCTRPA